MRRHEPWIIVPCPVCKVQAGNKCTGQYYQCSVRRTDGYRLHKIWELAGADPYVEEEYNYPPVNT